MQVPRDHIAYRYEVHKVLGKGSFGQVVHAYDHKLHVRVALKIVRNEQRFHRQVCLSPISLSLTLSLFLPFCLSALLGDVAVCTEASRNRKTQNSRRFTLMP